MSRPSILLTLTSSVTMGGTREPTGLWFEELATPTTPLSLLVLR